MEPFPTQRKLGLVLNRTCPEHIRKVIIIIQTSSFYLAVPLSSTHNLHNSTLHTVILANVLMEGILSIESVVHRGKVKTSHLFLTIRGMVQTSGVLAPKNYDQN